jgi:hypothetical protein
MPPHLSPVDGVFPFSETLCSSGILDNGHSPKTHLFQVEKLFVVIG